MFSQLKLGSKDALKFLKREKDQWPRFNTSENFYRIVYDVGQQAIDIPIPYLNDLTTDSTPLSQRTQRLFTVPAASLRKSVPYEYWLRLAGREETIHHYQNIGHPMLMAQYNLIHTEGTGRISYNDRFLCDIEVEARNFVDRICLKNSEEAVWKPIDDYLQRTRPEVYNKPITYFLKK